MVCSVMNFILKSSQLLFSSLFILPPLHFYNFVLSSFLLLCIQELTVPGLLQQENTYYRQSGMYFLCKLRWQGSSVASIIFFCICGHFLLLLIYTYMICLYEVFLEWFLFFYFENWMYLKNMVWLWNWKNWSSISGFHFNTN